MLASCTLHNVLWRNRGHAELSDGTERLRLLRVHRSAGVLSSSPLWRRRNPKLFEELEGLQLGQVTAVVRL
jgi:hypothetical protein